MSLLLSCASITNLKPRIFISIGFLFFSLLYLLYPTFHREDWKTLARHLPQNKPIYIISPSAAALKYYLGDTTLLRDLRDISIGKIQEKSLVVIPYTAPIYKFDYTTELTQQGYKQRAKKVFRGLEFEIWVKI